MAFRPEQRRALDYLQRKGPMAPLPELRSELHETFRQLESLLGTLGRTPIQRRPEKGQWSLVEIVDHLVESHRPAVGQIRASLRLEDPGGPVAPSLLSPDPTALEWGERVAALEAVHADLLADLAGAEDLQEGTPIPVAMVIKARRPDGSTEVLEWVEPLHWKAYAAAVRVHTLEHVAQIRRVAAALEADGAGG